MENLRWRIKLVKAQILVSSLLTGAEKHLFTTLDFLFQGLNTALDMAEVFELFPTRSDGRDDPGKYIWQHIELHLGELHDRLIANGWQAHFRTTPIINENQEQERVGERYYTRSDHELTVRFGSYGFIACLRNMRGDTPSTAWYHKEGQMFAALKYRGLWGRGQEAA